MPKGIFLPLDVDFASNKDLARLRRFGRDVRGLRDLLVQMWCYCKRHQTDGHIPAEEVGLMVYPDTLKTGERDAGRLVEVGIAERTEHGYFLPDYLKHNKSRAQISEESQRKAENGKKGGEVSGQVRRAKANAKQGASDGLNTETETETNASTEPVVIPFPGERTETLRAVDATEPTCSKHPLGDAGDACGGCAKVRTWRDRNETRAQRDAEHRRSKALLDEIAATRAAAVPRPKETTQ